MTQQTQVRVDKPALATFGGLMNTVARFPLVCFVFCTGIYTARFVWICSELQSPVAVHFGFGGEVNRWSDKTSFVVLSSLLSVVVLGLFGALAAFGAKLPIDLTNLPHKEYWLAPERRAATQRTMSAAMAWTGCVVVLLLGAVHEGIYRVNATRDPGALAPLTCVIAGAVVALLLIALLTCLRFWRVPSVPAPRERS